ncbi:SPOSA6832_05078, partial [Sporobolomyces salmonicolor]
MGQEGQATPAQIWCTTTTVETSQPKRDRHLLPSDRSPLLERAMGHERCAKGGPRLEQAFGGLGFELEAKDGKQAIAAARQGYSVTVLERTSGLSPHGDLITLGSNAAKVLVRWGLGEQMWRRSAKGGWWLLKDKDGNDVGGCDHRDFPAIYGAPIFQGHRAQYLAVLGIEARMLMVQFRPYSQVVEYREQCIIVADGLNSGGRKILASALDHASGAPSPPTSFAGSPTSSPSLTSTTPTLELARSLMPSRLVESEGTLPMENGEQKKRYSVHRAAMSAEKIHKNPRTACQSRPCFRGRNNSNAHSTCALDTADFLDGCVRTYLGADSHLKIAPLDSNRQVSFTFVSPDTYASASTDWRDRRSVAEVTEKLRKEEWDPTVIEAVQMFGTCLNWRVVEDFGLPFSFPFAVQIVLIGDAVHPLSPMSFQGGSQAIEDGAALAVCLALAGGKNCDVPRALRTFEVLRKPRVKKAQEAGIQQRLLWHSFYTSRAPASLDLLISENYDFDAERNTLASFERTCQQYIARDFVLDQSIKKKVIKTLEVSGGRGTADKFDLAVEGLFDRGGKRPSR